jgi:hypothetical protein
VSRQKIDECFCWFVVPEIIIGVPKYDQASCIAYLLDKLKQNGFNVKYIHPNTLFISWLHWVPSYVRTELKKKTGILVDEFGRKVEENMEENNNITIINPDNFMLNKNTDDSQKNKQQKKEYTPIKSYKPSGNLVYDDEMLNTIENKFFK